MMKKTVLNTDYPVDENVYYEDGQGQFYRLHNGVDIIGVTKQFRTKKSTVRAAAAKAHFFAWSAASKRRRPVKFSATRRK